MVFEVGFPATIEILGDVLQLVESNQTLNLSLRCAVVWVAIIGRSLYPSFNVVMIKIPRIFFVEQFLANIIISDRLSFPCISRILVSFNLLTNHQLTILSEEELEVIWDWVLYCRTISRNAQLR